MLTFVGLGYRFVHVICESSAVFEGHVDPLSDRPWPPQLPNDAVEYRLHVAVEAPQPRRHITETHNNTSLVEDSQRWGSRAGLQVNSSVKHLNIGVVFTILQV